MDLPTQEPVVSMQPSANSNEVKRKVSIVEGPDARNYAYENSAFDSGNKRKTSQVINCSLQSGNHDFWSIGIHIEIKSLELNWDHPRAAE